MNYCHQSEKYTEARSGSHCEDTKPSYYNITINLKLSSINMIGLDAIPGACEMTEDRLYKYCQTLREISIRYHIPGSSRDTVGADMDQSLLISHLE